MHTISRLLLRELDDLDHDLSDLSVRGAGCNPFLAGMCCLTPSPSKNVPEAVGAGLRRSVMVWIGFPFLQALISYFVAGLLVSVLWVLFCLRRQVSAAKATPCPG